MKIFISRAFFTSLVCLMVITSTTKAQKQEVTISEPAPVKVEELFKQADLIAVVHILSGDTEHYQTAVYKAEVLQPFKGTEKGATIYFGPFIRYELGGELIAFLRCSKEGTEPKQQTASSGLTYGPISPFYLVMYEGYSALRTDYECVFDGKEIAQQCDDGVEVNTSQVILPKGIRTFPSATKGAFSRETNWVRKNVFIAYLRKLSK
jgi:hypothetical protein